jgi:hypothetical protein
MYATEQNLPVRRDILGQAEKKTAALGLLRAPA